MKRIFGMKKLLGAAVLCGAMIFASAGTAAATTSAEVKIATNRPVVAKGKQVQVTIQLEEAPSAAGLSFSLKYDPSKVKIVQDASNKDMIAYGSAFAYYGGRTVDKIKGLVTAMFELQQYQVSSTSSLSIHAGSNGLVGIAGTATARRISTT